jgi:phosphatidylglycerophosphate synthase
MRKSVAVTRRDAEEQAGGIDVRDRTVPGPGASPPLRQFVARRFAATSPPVSWFLFERLGGSLAWLLAQFRVAPAVPTLLGGAAGVLGALALASASDGGDQLLAGGLLLLSYTLDCTDGQLARATGRASDRGAWLDVAVDAVVIAFVAAALNSALLTEGQNPASSMLLAGAYGASRTVSLFTSTRVRSSNGGIRLTGARSVLRSLFVAPIDTPVTYLAFCASRLAPSVLGTVVAVVTVLTATQALVSAQHHFSTPPPAADR